MPDDLKLRCEVCDARMDSSDRNCRNCGTAISGIRALQLDRARKSQPLSLEFPLGITLSIVLGVLWAVAITQTGYGLPYATILIGAIIAVSLVRHSHNPGTRIAVLALCCTLGSVAIGKGIRVAQYNSRFSQKAVKAILIEEDPIVEAIVKKMTADESFSDATMRLLKTKPDTFHIETINEARAAYRELGDGERLAMAETLQAADTVQPTFADRLAFLANAFRMEDLLWIPLGLLTAFAVGLDRRKHPAEADTPPAPKPKPL